MIPKAALPNAMTAGNVLLGFLSLLISVETYLHPGDNAQVMYETACWLILWATLLDVLDGKVAKLTGSTSAFGMKLDTFADAVTFGLAPAGLLACTLLTPQQGLGSFGWIACGLYFTAATFRLARYNVLTLEESFGFVGLPTPTAAMICVGLFLTRHNYPVPAAWVLALVLVVAAAMVSPFRYPALKGLAPAEKKFVGGLLACMALGSLLFGPALVILVVFGSFTFSWGLAWIPLRHLWIPAAGSKRQRSHR